jgi:hypothetical protein
MTRLHRRTLLLFAAATWAWPAAAETPLTLEALMARMAAAPARRAQFRETRRFAALDGALESRGWLSFTRGVSGGRLEKMTEWPEPERLEVDGARIVITAGNEPPRVIDTGMAPPLGVLIDAIRAPLSGDVAALRRGFEVALSGTMQQWHMELVPRVAGVLRVVRLDGSGDVVSRIDVVQQNGDEQMMAITPA